MADRPPEATRLDFNVVDEAVQLLRSEAEPWSIHLEARVAGRLDGPRLRRAVAQALARHPMARARRARSRLRDRGYRWEITESPDLDPVRVLDCADDAMLADVRDAVLSVGVPLVASPPLRVGLIHCPGGDVVMLNVSHTATDGVGAVRMLHSIARAYSGAVDPTPDVDLSAARHLQGWLRATDRKTRARRRAVLRRKSRDLLSPPARMAAEQGSDNPGYGVHLVRLGPDETRRLVAAECGGTVNDILLAALHLAVDRWNRERGARCPRIAVMLPINLRPAEWREEVVGNFSLMATVSTLARERAGPVSALDAVVARTGDLKSGTGASLIEALAISPLVPLWAKRATVPLLGLTGNRLVDTAMLSNLGCPSAPEFGADAGATTELWFSPPCRLPLGLALGAVTAAGRLHLAFRYRHPLMSRAAAGRFAEDYLGELDRLLDAVGCRDGRVA